MEKREHWGEQEQQGHFFSWGEALCDKRRAYVWCCGFGGPGRMAIGGKTEAGSVRLGAGGRRG